MLPQAATMIISQQGFPTILSASSQHHHHHQQQQQQQQQEPLMGLLKQDSTPTNKKPARVTKIRRTRQSRNPQQSVARRNERERNRVKLINKGFDVLRDNLPAEYLETVAPEKCAALEGEETPDLQASCKKSSKAKKFSKVDTLRAAIQHIRMLEELIRSADPHFELAKIAGAISDESLMLGYDELDSEPLSIGQPASCASSSLSSSQNSHSSPLVHQHQSYPVYEQHQPTEQFVKLEPHIHQQIAPPQQAQPQPLETQSAHFQMITQVHHDQHLQQQHQMSPPSESSSDQTHQWIQQHQTTFGEQQQFPDQTQAQWYANTFVQQQQQQQHLVLEQQLSPVSLDSPAGQMQHHQHQHQNQQTQLWYAESSPSPRQTAQQQLQGAQMSQLAAFSTHQQHQIGLYSQ